VDGSGYPAHLKGSDIPLVSRIVCVIDAYDAMISHRCYCKSVGHEEAARRASAGTQFDAGVVQVFLPIAESEAGDVFAAAGTSTAAVL
jgi:HD-GYP domain-containing protein (c-di-GMP phosphodiesterase class II)